MFDRLIVDEGQDLSQEAFEILRLLLKENADVVWMEDTDQNLGQRAIDGESFCPDEFVRLRLSRNYRSPLKIANYIRDKLPFDFEPANALPGHSVRTTAYRDDAEQIGLVEEAIDRLLDQGFGLRISS